MSAAGKYLRAMADAAVAGCRNHGVNDWGACVDCVAAVLGRHSGTLRTGAVAIESELRRAEAAENDRQDAFVGRLKALALRREARVRELSADRELLREALTSLAEVAASLAASNERLARELNAERARSAVGGVL